MSDQPQGPVQSLEPLTAASTEVAQAQIPNAAERVYPWPIIDKSLPRPAPTEVYSWSKYNPDTKIHYLTDHARANSVLQSSVFDGAVLGFDLEWRPNYIKGNPENPVALIQLASNDSIFLVQISGMREFPLVLADILANPSIVKAGVAIQNDAYKLYNDCHVTMCNCVDLSMFARTVDNARWQGKYTSPLGLGRLVESYEYLILEKGRITRSNWEASLIPAQIEYACNDAHAAYILHQRFEQMKELLPTPPDPKWYSFNLVSARLCNPDGTDWNVHNPMYNAGPPPPPRIPREYKPEDGNDRPPLERNGPSSSQRNPTNARDKRKFSGRSNFTPRFKDYEALLPQPESTAPPQVPHFHGSRRPRAIHTSSHSSSNLDNVGSSSRSQHTDANHQVNPVVHASSSRPPYDYNAKPVSSNYRGRHFKRPSSTRNHASTEAPAKDTKDSATPRQPAHTPSEPRDRTGQDTPRTPRSRRTNKPRSSQHANPAPPT